MTPLDVAEKEFVDAFKDFVHVFSNEIGITLKDAARSCAYLAKTIDVEEENEEEIMSSIKETLKRRIDI